jgi:hypothetical protein
MPASRAKRLAVATMMVLTPLPTIFLFQHRRKAGSHIDHVAARHGRIIEPGDNRLAGLGMNGLANEQNGPQRSRGTWMPNTLGVTGVRMACVDEARAGDRFRPRTGVAFGLGPDADERQ